MATENASGAPRGGSELVFEPQPHAVLVLDAVEVGAPFWRIDVVADEGDAEIPPDRVRHLGLDEHELAADVVPAAQARPPRAARVVAQLARDEALKEDALALADHLLRRARGQVLAEIAEHEPPVAERVLAADERVEKVAAVAVG